MLVFQPPVFYPVFLTNRYVNFRTVLCLLKKALLPLKVPCRVSKFAPGPLPFCSHQPGPLEPSQMLCPGLPTPSKSTTRCGLLPASLCPAAKAETRPARSAEWAVPPSGPWLSFSSCSHPCCPWHLCPSTFRPGASRVNLTPQLSPLRLLSSAHHQELCLCWPGTLWIASSLPIPQNSLPRLHARPPDTPPLLPR